MSDLKNPEKLIVNSLSDQAYVKLKEHILNGTLKWGERLDIIKIAKAYDVSRAPIIKAIEKLAIEQLVIIIPNKGSFVITPTAKDINAVNEIRTMMEITACRLAFEKHCDETGYQLRDNQNAFRNFDDFNIFLSYDRKFHEIIFKNADNVRLFEMYSTVRAQSELYRTKTFFFVNKEKALHDHNNIVVAFEKKDLNLVLNCMNAHMRNVYEDSINSLS